MELCDGREVVLLDWIVSGESVGVNSDQRTCSLLLNNTVLIITVGDNPSSMAANGQDWWPHY